LLAILPANFAAQEHDGRRYRQIGGRDIIMSTAAEGGNCWRWTCAQPRRSHREGAI
jgi:hypothetical protein